MSLTDTREPAPGGRILVLSPHLDDGVFACGQLLASLPPNARATVATVFAGFPDPRQPLTDWDRASGFPSGREAVAARREEDRAALSHLGAWPLWLDLKDAQYGGASPAEVRAALWRALLQCEPDSVFFPLGLFHSDHRLVHEAALALVADCPSAAWLVYEDALYRRLAGFREEALADLGRRGLETRPVPFAFAPAAGERKAAAVACYRSQLQALATPGRPGQADLGNEENYWRLIHAKEEHP